MAKYFAYANAEAAPLIPSAHGLTIHYFAGPAQAKGAKARLEALPDHTGAPIGTKVFKPEEIYREVNGIPPDLIVYFGDLFWRSVGSVGHDSIYTFDNDTGPDDCNHAQYGIVIKHDPAKHTVQGGRELHGLQLMDMAPTILAHMGVPIPPDMQGRVF